jgi:DNA-binding beta-propeller fold protein YncE
MRFDPRITAAVLIMAAFALCTGGCSEEDPAGPGTPVSWALLAPHTHLVDADQSPLEFEYAIDSTYFFRIPYQTPRIVRGDIILGSAGEGYIRRVTEVSVSSGRMILQTARARLADAVLHGETEVSIPIGFGSITSAVSARAPASIEPDRQPALTVPYHVRCAEGVVLSGGGIDISGLTLFEEEISGYPASISVAKGFVGFDPSVHLYMRIRDGAIWKLESSVDGTFTLDCDLSIDIPETIDVEGEIPLASAERRIVHYMGAVPIVALIELDFILTYRFVGLYPDGCGAAFRGTFDLTLGALYELGRWVDISSLEPEASGNPFSCVQSVDANLQISVEPRIALSLYGEAIADMACGAHDSFAVSAYEPPAWEWSMFSRMEGGYAIDPDILAREPSGHAIVPITRTLHLGSGPYSTDSYIFDISWGSEGSGDYQFAYPLGISSDAAGDIYVVDSWNNRIQKFAPDSTFIMKWGTEGSGEGQFLFPTAAAVDASGNIYVTDSGNNRVQKFGPDAAFITEWGGSGSGPGEFQAPQGIAVDPSGDIYVVDSGNHRVQKFTPVGLFITEWGGYGTGPSEFDTPAGIAADGAGDIYVTECRNNRVQKFTSSGDPLALWGIPGAGDGEFDCPISIAVDEDGFIYVVDYGNDRLNIFSAEGGFLEELGGPGDGEGQFDRPEGVTVDQDGNIYIADSRNERVQKFVSKTK